MITKKEQIIEYFKSGIKNKKEFNLDSFLKELGIEIDKIESHKDQRVESNSQKEIPNNKICMTPNNS